MNSTGNLCSEEIPVVTVSTLRLPICAFLSKMTEGQWILLKSGSPDDATKIFLAELLLEIIQEITNTYLASLRNTCVAISEEQVETSLELLLEDLENKDFNYICRSHGEELQTPEEEPEDAEEEPEDAEEEPQQDPFVAETAKVVQEIIERAVSDITVPLLQDVAESEYQQLQSESSFYIEVVSNDISELIASEVRSLTPQSKEKPRLSMREASSIIKSLFVKVLAKSSMHRIVAELKRKFRHESEAESSQSMQSLIDSFESLLLVENGDKQKDQGGNELSLFPRYKTLSGNNLAVVTNKLTEMMYSYIKYGTVTIPEAIRRKAAAHPVVNPAMYQDIWKKIRCFLALINWWQKTQAASHSDRLTLALQGTESIAQSPLKEVAEENACLIPTPVPATKRNKKRSRPSQKVAGVQEDTMGEINKKAVLFLVERLVSGLYNKAKLSWTTTQPEVIIQRLFQRIWAEVEGAELRITPETFEDLDKAVIKPLLKNWGCATIT
eukprot:superscaffoldBa00000440_g4744